MHTLRHRDPAVGTQIDQAMLSFNPGLIVNQAQRHEKRNLGKEVALACKDFLGINLTLAGTVRADEQVLLSLNSRRPVITTYPNSSFAEDVRRIVQKLGLLMEM